MLDLDRIRNIDIAAHIDHGKTTLSDNLISGAGLMSEELAGKQLVMDFDEEEQARGITIYSAAASMIHHIDGRDYLINLIDTPGHVDFGGEVTRAMRASDGCVTVCCAVEGPMPQTETVLRQALREKVKPILFINKVDRLVNELKLTPEAMQQRFVGIIAKINGLIQKMAPDDATRKWSVKVDDGSVVFGSAFNNWAVSLPYMKKAGVTFKDVFNHCEKGTQKELAKKAPLHKVLLDAVIMHHPSPLQAQKYRIPHIWHGDISTKQGKAMMDCDHYGDLTFMVTKIVVDPHAGEVAIGRLFSGTITGGMDVHVLGQPGTNKIQQVGLMVGADRIPVDKVLAGNIAAVTGLRTAVAGSTVTTNKDMDPFERIVHVSDPVVTVAVEAKHTKDLPKLVEVLRQISKADPTIVIQINQETGEHLMSGMGELHLEVVMHRIARDYKLEITGSEPIVVYRESVTGKGPDRGFEGKSPNKHNRFYFEVEQLPQEIITALRNNEIPEDVRKHKDEVAKKFQGFGWSKEEVKGVTHINGTNVMVDMTKGIQNLFETMELVKEAFDEVVNRGPRTHEPIMGLKAMLVDAKLHDDAVHRGPAQTIPAVRNSIYGAMTVVGTTLMEPMQKVVVTVPQERMGDVTREMGQRRGTIVDMKSEGDAVTIETTAPVAEMFGFASAIRGATGGRALWSTENTGFQPLPHSLLDGVTRKIRERKGLPPEPYDASYYSG
ncbi:MAG: elongation factor EF-2 [Euryarchaeota archaeon]|nr:elongation factor EF-2 [Euryarchaeota archaeon]